MIKGNLEFTPNEPVLTLYSKSNMDASEPKLANPVLNSVGVNSLRLGGIHTMYHFRHIQVKGNYIYEYKIVPKMSNLT